MAIITEPGHPSCRCRILESGRWVFSGEPSGTTDKGNPSPCETCLRLGRAHNRRLGFMDSESAKNITFNQIEIIKRYENNNGTCPCGSPD